MVPGKEDLEGQQDTEGRLLFSEQMPKTFPAEQAGPPSDGRLWPAGKKNEMTVLKKTHVITVMRVYPIRRMRTMKYRKRLTVRAETGILRISKLKPRIVL